MLSIETRLAAELAVKPQQIAAAVALLDAGSTVPFIARYRKEATEGLDDSGDAQIDPHEFCELDLFRRAGTQDRPGQGIGLAHVRALVRRLGGTMSVASELDQGSTFTITLPINWNVSNRNSDR